MIFQPNQWDHYKWMNDSECEFECGRNTQTHSTLTQNWTNFHMCTLSFWFFDGRLVYKDWWAVLIILSSWTLLQIINLYRKSIFFGESIYVYTNHNIQTIVIMKIDWEYHLCCSTLIMELSLQYINNMVRESRYLLFIRPAIRRLWCNHYTYAIDDWLMRGWDQEWDDDDDYNNQVFFKWLKANFPKLTDALHCYHWFIF